jgi:hypothetical protein
MSLRFACIPSSVISKTQPNRSCLEVLHETIACRRSQREVLSRIDDKNKMYFLTTGKYFHHTDLHSIRQHYKKMCAFHKTSRTAAWGLLAAG